MNTHLRTYTSGPSFKATGSITSKTIVSLIDALKRAFGEDYDFAPEAITEGGIVFTRWPNKEPRHYKTLRFRVEHTFGRWPTIIRDRDNQIESWRNSEERVIWKSTTDDALNRKRPRETQPSGGTFLKALLGAPCWTPQELELFKRAFEEVGLKFGRMPAAKHLREKYIKTDI